ncbi:hypothetical protein J7I94_33605 [Streptomyces sp. ISL-12]|uniref:hypothetical protein n=1 Tax=Streptomyces sp. ISL-12 TaxID=2819177 RepID=UPI001BE910D7|nr:hypothetical protein [Streptomyces sp. ISL-12]MBT2415416.1 hypothetical protein [Streptomyces sp. ISL-12]
MQSQDAAPRPAPSAGDPVVDVEQAEAALVEHYPRLARLAYLVLPPALGRTRRVLTAHALVQRALPRNRTPAPAIPAQSTGRAADPGYALVRLRVVRTALEAGLPLRRRVWPGRSPLPPPLPRVWGLRLFPRPGGADELALDRALSALSGPARAAYALRGLEELPDAEVRQVLAASGVTDGAAALAEAGSVPGTRERYALLSSAEFDPCSLQARPTDLMRRRQRLRVALAAGAALVAGGALLGPLGDGWGPDGPAAPPYAHNASARAALDPGRLTEVSPTAWRTSARTDFSVWPARGDLTGDRGLLRRALAVWARPGDTVRVSTTPGTPSGGPPGPPQLLYAGTVDAARVVLLYDGLRVVRYAEPRDSTAGAALDLARADGAGRDGATAVVLGRADGNVRYLTAPWVTKAAERDLTEPEAEATELPLTDGVTAPLAGPVQRPGDCASWNTLELTDGSTTRLVSDLGELVPARLTAGRPGAAEEVSGTEERRAWAPYACSLGAVRGQGVRSVNAWEFARQRLPHATGTATWVCTRAETWRGTGAKVLAQFHTPGGRYGTVAAKAVDVPACGERAPRVLAGVLWESAEHGWYLLAAGNEAVSSIRATGGIDASADDNVLAAEAEQGARADLRGTLEDGRTVDGLH